MKTNDLKKSTRIKLANGWSATLEDNKHGNIRMATVEGFYTEMGSIYAHDIVSYFSTEADRFMPVEHTEAQLKCKTMNEQLFG